MTPLAAPHAVVTVPVPAARRRSAAQTLQRALRLLPQLACLGTTGALGSAGPAVPVTYLVGQLVIVLIALALRGGGGPAELRRSRAGLLQGVATSALAVPVLGALGVGTPAAQLAVVGVLALWWGLGVARDAFLAAGDQLDAVLATLPPPDRARSLPVER